MLNDKLINDYSWTDTKSCAHNYLLIDINKTMSELNVKKTDQILDAGCGGGNLVFELYKKGFNKIWGFDISESGINVAKNTFDNIKNRFVIHNIYDSKLPKPVPQEGYDFILSTEVIEHLFSPHLYMQNLHEWLKPEGHLLITTPYHGYIKNLAITLTNRFDAHMTSLWEGGHIKFFSKETLFSLLRENGFEPIEFKGCGRIPYLWKSMMVVAQKK